MSVLAARGEGLEGGIELRNLKLADFCPATTLSFDIFVGEVPAGRGDLWLLDLCADGLPGAGGDGPWLDLCPRGVRALAVKAAREMRLIK